MTTRSMSRRAFTGLIALIALIATLVISPVGAHITKGVKHTAKHLRKIFYTKSDADARFLTPAQGDGRYLTPAQGDGRYLTPAQGDERYLSASGEIRLNASPLDWVKVNPAITQVPEAKPSIGATTFGGSTAAASAVPFAISPTLPTVLIGRPLALVGVEACYSTNEITTLTAAKIFVTRNTSGVGSTSLPFIDPTDRGPNESACRAYLLPDPLPLLPQDDVAFEFDVDYSANAGFFHAKRATFILRVG